MAYSYTRLEGLLEETVDEGVLIFQKPDKTGEFCITPPMPRLTQGLQTASLVSCRVFFEATNGLVDFLLYHDGRWNLLNRRTGYLVRWGKFEGFPALPSYVHAGVALVNNSLSQIYYSKSTRCLRVAHAITTKSHFVLYGVDLDIVKVTNEHEITSMASNQKGIISTASGYRVLDMNMGVLL